VKPRKLTTNNNSTDDATSEVLDFVAKIFTDPQHWHQIDYRIYLGEFRGQRIGAVLATMAQGFYQYALNAGEVDGLLKAKQGGRIDQAFIVSARQDGPNQFRYCSAREAEEFQAVLAALPLRTGRSGGFWSLHPTVFGENVWTM
jgi:hypothetical protein